jgi:hypothetical protein
MFQIGILLTTVGNLFLKFSKLELREISNISIKLLEEAPINLGQGV